jgi:hypothetical protein
MPGSTSGGRAFRAQDVTLHASAPETATGASAGVEVGDVSEIRLLLNVTAVSGTTPTLDITVETSFDNGVTDAWRALGTFAQKTAVSTERKDFAGCDRWVRSRRVIAGTTPSFTYDITGDGV